MIYFSIFILFIAVLDTLFGNRFFPSRVDVICKHRQYFVRKVHRYCFIPILQYLGHHDSERIQFNFRLNFSRAFPFTKEAAKSCGVVHDRDVNSSRNILKEGLKIFGQGLSNTKVERKSDVSNNAHSMKPEAHPIAFGVGG